MTKEYYTPQEVAELLNVTRQTVYSWINKGRLKAKKFGRLKRIPREALETTLEPAHPAEGESERVRTSTRSDSREEQPSLGTAVMTRRDFLFLGITATITVASKLLFQGYPGLINELLEKRERDKEAKKIFREVFGNIGERWSYELGRLRDTIRIHPDNYAAGKALIEQLALPHSASQVLAASTDLEIDPSGDLVLFGGSNSTRLTMIAWQYEGPNSLELRRPDEPILPLRWYGIADSTDPSVRTDNLIGYRMEGVGPVSTFNWPFVDTRDGDKRIRPQTGKRITVNGDAAYLPVDNYLLVTRLPNFLTPHFKTQQQFDPSVWPHLLVFEGSNGCGTRGAELLKSPAGLKALEDTKGKIGAANEFQALFRLTDIELTPAKFHRFNTIELVDAEPLDTIDAKTYREAHHYAMDVRHRMAK